MSDIPGSNSPIQIEGARFRSPVSEALIQQLGAGINFLLARGLKLQEFNRTLYPSGTTTWTVPDGVTHVMLFGCGGGGGGSGHTYNSTYAVNIGGAGGPGVLPEFYIYPVTPLSSVSINIGAGGAGGATNASGGAGGNTTFGPLTFYGAPGAIAGSATVRFIYGGFASLDVGAQANLSGIVGTNQVNWVYYAQSPWGVWDKGQKLNWGGCPQHNVTAKKTAAASPWGAAAANGTGAVASVGGGGGSSFGTGGVGANPGAAGGDAPATSYGAGGGGGGAAAGAAIGKGGAGAGGYLAVMWFGADA